MSVEAIFGLPENSVGVGFEDICRDFLATVGGEAVHDEGSGRSSEEFGVDLVFLKLGEAIGGFFFLAHADPDVGIEDVGSGDGFGEVFGDGDFTTSPGNEVSGRLEGAGGGEAEFESTAGGGPDPGAANVAIGVADEGDLEVSQIDAGLTDGEEVGEDLAGMLLVGEGVDGGNLAVFREINDIALGKGTDDGAVDHAAEDASGVLDRFAATELDVVGGKEKDVTAEFADADLEADAGAGGGLGEHEGPAFAFEGLGGVLATSRFHRGGFREDFLDLREGEGLDV